MPTQVQGLITSSYDAVIEVPANGEVLTEAQFTNTAVALGNRIQFVLDNPGETPSPESLVEVRDEFLCTDQVGVPGKVVTSDGLWRFSTTGTVIFGYDSSPKNPGSLVVTVPGDGAVNQFDMSHGVSSTGDQFSFANFKRMVWVVRIDSPTTNLSASFDFGLSENSNSTSATNELAFTIHPNPGTPNALLRTIKASGGVIVTNLVTPYVSGEFLIFRAEKLTSGNVDIYVNNVLRTTVLAANMPVGNATFFARIRSTVSDVAGSSASMDFAYIRANPGARQGV